MQGCQNNPTRVDFSQKLAYSRSQDFASGKRLWFTWKELRTTTVTRSRYATQVSVAQNERQKNCATTRLHVQTHIQSFNCSENSCISIQCTCSCQISVEKICNTILHMWSNGCSLNRPPLRPVNLASMQSPEFPSCLFSFFKLLRSRLAMSHWKIAKHYKRYLFTSESWERRMQ